MKEAIGCAQFELLLAEQLDKPGLPQDWGLLEAHAASCPRCARKLEAERQLEDWLRARFPPPRLEQDFSRRLLDRLEPCAPAAIVPRWVEWLEVGACVSLTAAAAWMVSLAPVGAVGRWLASVVPHYATWGLAAAVIGFWFWLISEACSVRVDS